MTVDEELADAQRWLAVTSAHMPTAVAAKLPAKSRASRRNEGSAWVGVADIQECGGATECGARGAARAPR